MTGLGAGINYQLNNNFSLTGSLDINRSSDAVDEIYKIHKLFYHGSHTVNKYMELSLGLSWWFNMGGKKNAHFFQQENGTDKQLIRSKPNKKKGRAPHAYQYPWYDHKRGK